MKKKERKVTLSLIYDKKKLLILNTTKACANVIAKTLLIEIW